MPKEAMHNQRCYDGFSAIVPSDSDLLDFIKEPLFATSKKACMDMAILLVYGGLDAYDRQKLASKLRTRGLKIIEARLVTWVPSPSTKETPSHESA